MIDRYDTKIQFKEDKGDGLKLYTLNLPISDRIEINKVLNERELKDILEQICVLFGFQEIIDAFKCTIKEAEKIHEFWEKRSGISDHSLCANCSKKLIECYRCVIVCESPLERVLFVELLRKGINPELQLRISKQNELTHFPTPVDLPSVLTVPDFYIANGDRKVCIYTDGHTYHERTEYQAMRDRNIDRELQNFGYTVLRFTGKEIRVKIDSVVADICRALGNN
ncbi:DUF559 domain-containing protein [uncultured Sphaerochaeta sp.]|uniref:DUF559 domain-containing protein n=1 Tax=uncultured Sphaerochaeta sp. TaxID=886478 RepID=UPI002AA69610|nr:DUF559 domain-containing protein [uncultured Sphaerochaeta sp.]